MRARPISFRVLVLRTCTRQKMHSTDGVLRRAESPRLYEPPPHPQGVSHAGSSDLISSACSQGPSCEGTFRILKDSDDVLDAMPRLKQLRGRGLYSSTFRLNLSAFCGIGGAFRGCLGGVYEVSGCIRG